MSSTTPSLMSAASEGDADAVRSLLAEGADVNETSQGGQTPLMRAVIRGHVDIVRLLLDAGADVRVKDRVGLTAMDWSDRRGFWDLGRLLKDAAETEAGPQASATAAAITPGHILSVARQQRETTHEPEHSRVEAILQSVPEAKLATTQDVGSQGQQQSETSARPERHELEPPQAEEARRESVTHAMVPVEQDVDSRLVEQTDSTLDHERRPLEEARLADEELTRIKARREIERSLEESRRRDEEETLRRFQEDVLRKYQADTRDVDRAKSPSQSSTPLAAAVAAIPRQSPKLAPWASPTLWVLVGTTMLASAFVAYLLINRLSENETPSAPVAVATPTAPAEIRKDLPTVGGALSGMEVNVPEAEYPAKAKNEGVSGTVTVRVQVNKKGWVILARSSRGDWRLRAAALKAAQKATFSPEKLAGKGNQGGVVSGTITYNFVAQTESPAASVSQAPAQTNPPSAAGSLSATGSSAANMAADYPVVGGPLVGAESNLPQPDYPEKAKSKGISGTITVVVRVNRAGRVISWRTLEGDNQLRAAALKAAKKATFSPEKLPGSGEVVGTITYNFKP